MGRREGEEVQEEIGVEIGSLKWVGGRGRKCRRKMVEIGTTIYTGSAKKKVSFLYCVTTHI